VTTNQVLSAMSDSNVVAFVNTAGISDLNDQLRIARAVEFLKKKNRWRFIDDINLLHPRYNPTSNLSFYLQPRRVWNPSYSRLGFVTHGTNSFRVALRNPIAVGSPHTEFIVFQDTPTYVKGMAEPSGFGNTTPWLAGANSIIGGVADSNSWYGTFLNRAYQNGSVVVSDHTGASTNWYAPSGGSFADTNNFTFLNCGGFGNFRYELGLKVFALSTWNTNQHRVWHNAVPAIPAVWQQSTNLVFSSPILVTNVMNEWEIGTNSDYKNYTYAIGAGGGPNPFGAAGNYGSGYEQEFQYLIEVSTNCDQGFVDDVTTAIGMLMPQNVFSIAMGTSMISPDNNWVRNPVTLVTYRSWTNNLSYIRSQMFPDENYADCASSGSSAAMMVYTSGSENNWPYSQIPTLFGWNTFPTNFVWDLSCAGLTVNLLGCDSYMNDLGGANLPLGQASAAQAFNFQTNAYLPLMAAGANLHLQLTALMSPVLDELLAMLSAGTDHNQSRYGSASSGITGTNTCLAGAIPSGNVQWIPGTTNDFAYSTNSGVTYQTNQAPFYYNSGGGYFYVIGLTNWPVTAHVYLLDQMTNHVGLYPVYKACHALLRNFFSTAYTAPKVVLSEPVGILSTNQAFTYNMTGGNHYDNPTYYNILVEEVRALEGQGFQWFNPTNPSEKWSNPGNIINSADGVNLLYQTADTNGVVSWSLK